MSDAPKAGSGDACEKTVGAEPPPLLKALSSPADLRKAIARNSLAVLIGALAAANVLRIGSNLILTRLLAPEAFGVIGVITAISVILAMLTDMGFAPFVIRSPRGNESRFLNVIWTVRLFRSALLTVLMIVLAGPLALAFGKAELETPIRASSLLFLIEGVRALSLTTAIRERRVSFVSVIEFVVTVIQMAATLGAALVLKSYWAIIVGMYVGAATNVIFSYALFPGFAHRLAFDREIGKELWAFSRFVIVSSIITVILGQADKVFIGRTLSLDALGLYMLAVSLANAGQQLVLTYVGRVLLPAYAEAARQARESLAAIYYSARWRMTLVLAFLLGGGAGGGHLLARILFDERYLGAGIFISLLCLSPLFQLATRPAEQALVALGKVRSTVEANLVRLVWIALAAPAGFHFFGIIGLVAAFALIEAAAAPYWWARLRKEGLFNWVEEMTPMAAAALGAAIAIVFDRLTDYLIAAGMLPNF